VAAKERTGVLVVRAWIEAGELRARITYTRNIASARPRETVAGSAEEIVRAVERWLRGVVRDE
jgi:hypothetical protein